MMWFRPGVSSLDSRLSSLPLYQAWLERRIPRNVTVEPTNRSTSVKRALGSCARGHASVEAAKFADALVVKSRASRLQWLHPLR